MQNAFSKKMAPLGFNLFVMLIVDLMHEFELGVWRALLIHLLRILHAADQAMVHELDHRWVVYKAGLFLAGRCIYVFPPASARYQLLELIPSGDFRTTFQS
jgi:hypothetical protein